MEFLSISIRAWRLSLRSLRLLGRPRRRVLELETPVKMIWLLGGRWWKMVSIVVFFWGGELSGIFGPTRISVFDAVWLFGICGIRRRWGGNMKHVTKTYKNMSSHVNMHPIPMSIPRTALAVDPMMPAPFSCFFHKLSHWKFSVKTWRHATESAMYQ